MKRSCPNLIIYVHCWRLCDEELLGESNTGVRVLIQWLKFSIISSLSYNTSSTSPQRDILMLLYLDNQITRWFCRYIYSYIWA